MEKFVYKGETASGTAIEKTVEAEDRYAVYDIARTNGHVVKSVEAASKFSFAQFFNFEKLTYILNRVKADELVVVTRNLASMLNAGLALSRALSVLERQSKNPRLSGILKTVRGRIDKGDQFNEALKDFPKVFSPLYVSMVRAGEESGGLADSLETIGLQLERSSTLKKRIRGAMIYPAIVISVMAIIGVLMMIYVVPTLITTFERLDAELPTMTKILIGTSTFLTESGLLALLGALLFGIAVAAAARTRPGKRTVHYVLVHMPVIGTLVKETNAARTGRTLSSLLSAGVDVVSSIHITRDVVQNLYYKDVLDAAAERVERGEPISETFIESDHLYPILVGELVAVGEETGQISNMLGEVADFYEKEIEQKTENLSTIVEPILMVVIGAGVGFFALAMIGPIYSISESI